MSAARDPGRPATINSTACTAQARIAISSGESGTISSAVDPGHECGIEAQDPVHAQDVRHEVVREYAQRAEVPPVGDPGTLQVRGGDLGPLEEWELQPPMARLVRKQSHVPSRRVKRTAEPPSASTTAASRPSWLAITLRPRSRSEAA